MNDAFAPLAETCRIAVAALRDAGVRFALAGSFAAWARGGPQPGKDLDFMVKPQDADAALNALVEAGMRPERPPEEWLVKAWHGDTMIDVIFYPSGLDMTDEVLDRAEPIPVLAVETPVMALEDVLVTKLMALDEHALDYTSLLGIARACREQIDWTALRRRTGSSPYARAFFALIEALGIAA
ncbi:MAG: nucleotidyltransferase family protein [Solirubrobacteraceae bacterium]